MASERDSDALGAAGEQAQGEAGKAKAMSKLRSALADRMTVIESLEKLGAFFLVMGGYSAINRIEAYLASQGLLSGHQPSTPLDFMIPFAPIWCYPYYTLWIGMIAPFLWIRSHSYFRRMYVGYIGILVVSYVIFWAYPTTIDRPDAPAVTNFHEYLFLLLVNGDAPYNLLPSLHNALSQFAAWSIWTIDRRAGAFAWVWAIATSVSTLPVKQHWIADVLVGTSFAAIAWYVTLRPLAQRDPPDRGDYRSDLALLIPVVLQLALFGYLYWQYTVEY